MTNYRVWTNEWDKDMLLIQAFDSHFLLDIQKEFIDKGYVILETSFTENNNVFILVSKKKGELK